MRIEDMDRYTRTYNLIVNRVSVCNQICGCRYDFLSTNPVVLGHERGLWHVDFCRDRLAEWRVWDLAGVADALSRVDMLANVLWSGRRERLFSIDSGFYERRITFDGCSA